MAGINTKKAFEKKIQETVSGLCQPSDHTGYPYVLGTTLGLLWVSPQDDWVACRFEEPEKAREVYNCNPYSGKHNFHGDECVEDFTDLVDDLKRQNRLLDSDTLAVQLADYNAKWEAKRKAWTDNTYPSN